jgi:hypothetical protein
MNTNTKLEIKKFQINKKYSYTEIENFCNNDPDFSIEEYGSEVIGENFLILKDYHNQTYSFILDSVSNSDYIYKCIYNE